MYQLDIHIINAHRFASWQLFSSPIVRAFSSPIERAREPLAHRRRGDRGVRKFRQNATIQPTRGMPLLARCLAIRGQNLINERRDRAQLRPGAFRVIVLRWHSIDQPLARHPPVNA
jgi:hypothetical protein